MPSLKHRLVNFFKSQQAIFTLCVGIAFVFWFTTKMSNNDDFIVEKVVGIEFTKNKDLSFRHEADSTITFSVKGNGWLCSSVLLDKEKPLKIKLDSTISKPQYIGNNVVKSEILKQLGNNYRNIDNINPDHFVIQLDKTSSKRIPLHITYDSKDMWVKSHTLSPDSVTLYGSELDLNISRIEVPVKLEEMPGEYSGYSAISYPKFLKADNPKIGYTVTIDQLTEKEILMPINLPLDSTYDYTPKKILFNCITTLSDYHKVDTNDIRIKIPIDTSSTLPDTFEIVLNDVSISEEIISFKQRFNSIKIYKR